MYIHVNTHTSHSYTYNAHIAIHIATCIATFKYLGVIIDNKLTWHQHLENIKSEIKKGTGIQKKCITFCRKIHLSAFFMLF